ncbi:uncharacterized protein LOC132986831 isoform X2 [Labrus mixtus]|uniref:uncharacterized protein LOC132986831 isoform X2 n=1 Tax=Labrus mixtus TaxID=508554 RepID=UPI0029C00F69|nr:uncharacterized protein LOC132986831 isoform X2 [Labrus mixtus]
MVIMFHPNQAALLSLLFMHGVFADHESNHTDEEVSRGGSVIFTCNTSRETTKQINWSKGRFFFSHSMEVNKTASNLTSDRLTIDLSSKLIISKAQEDDEGLYTCLLTETKGKKIYQWNLTVSDKPEEEKSSGYFLYILTAGIGVVLCCIISATCLCRESKSWASNQDLTCSRTLIYAVVQVPFGGGAVPLNLPQSCVEYKMMNT